MPDRNVVTPDGRRLMVTELGDPDGFPVVFHHGTPGNRAAHNRSPAVLAGSRAIFYDRPGYGGSDRQRGRDIAACSDDVALIADSLGIERFAVAGSSGGGPHALACAALLRSRVTRVAVVAGFAPVDFAKFDFFAGMSEGNIAEFKAALAGEAVLTQELSQVVKSARDDPEAILDEIASQLPDADRRALARPDVRATFREAVGESVRTGLGGWIDDDLAFAKPWGFELTQIQQETLLMQGEQDFLVPRSHMDYIASQLPRARFLIVAGAGHTLYDEMREVVRWLLTGSQENGPCIS